MRRINEAQVIETLNVCPYCMNAVQIEPHMGCCGEVHAEKAYLVELEAGADLELLLESECEFEERQSGVSRTGDE